MDSARVDNSSFGWLVLTAASARQSAAYDRQLRDRLAHGALAGAREAFAVADARDARIGSGAATVLALVEVARRLARRKTARSMSALFAGERVAILHSGGDSRRLPMYAVEGKLFAPLPLRGRAGACETVFDLLLRDLRAPEPRAGGEVLVGAGDAVLGLARHPVRFRGKGVVGVAQRAQLARATRHGVFVRGQGGAVEAFLQKPGEREMRDAGAILGDGRALLDLGLFSFDPASVEALLLGSGVRLARGTIRVARGSLADRASRAELPPIDLYREIAMALPARASRAGYLASCGAGASRGPLGALFDAMRGTAFAVEEAEVGPSGGDASKAEEFLHVGSMREMLGAMCGRGARVRRFGVETDGARLQALDACAPTRRPAGRAIVDACDARALRLAGDNIVANLRGAPRGSLPRGVALFGVPLSSRREVLVACGVDDDFKTPLDAGGTVFGEGASRFFRRARLDAERARLIEGDGTLWDARLWCEPLAEDPLALVRWMWTARPAPEAWRRARKWTLRELVARSDLGAVRTDRARAVAERLRLEGAGSPVLRARALAVASGAEGLARSRAAMLRREAFAAVGEAVLSRFELPARPACAAILDDQAVWTSMPVRMDLAGGWTDTPPICNEVGGSVVNTALTLRGQLPIQVVAKLEVPERGETPVIRITSTDLGETRVIRSERDLSRRGDPTRWSSLAENALVLTGAAPADPRRSLASWLRAIGGGISLTMFSAVPKGSGLGTSSILGAATIHALDRVFGRERSPEELFAATSALEQMLGSRGGWQDQVGGVVGGFKIARTAPGADQRPSVERLAVPERLVRELSARSVLYFTGVRRMARNILENVVWNHLTQEPAAVDAVRRLHANAANMRESLLAGDCRGFIAELEEYRACKRRIDPGSCPASFDALAEDWRSELATWCFAGAGGGGFMLLVAKDPRSARRLSAAIERRPPHPRARAFGFEPDEVGLRCAVL